MSFFGPNKKKKKEEERAPPPHFCREMIMKKRYILKAMSLKENFHPLELSFSLLAYLFCSFLFFSIKVSSYTVHRLSSVTDPAIGKRMENQFVYVSIYSINSIVFFFSLSSVFRFSKLSAITGIFRKFCWTFFLPEL